MQFLPILIAFVLGVLALIFVLYPLYQRNLSKQPKEAAASPASQAQRESANGQDELLSDSEKASLENEQAARGAIQEVELDYQLGNISETDYRSLRERYLRRALVAMKSRYDREQEPDDPIEAQLRTMRENNGRIEQ